MLRRILGPRFAPEALFIVGVALVAALLELTIPAAVGLTLAAWLVVAVVEVALAHQRRQAPPPAEPSPVAGAVAQPERAVEALPAPEATADQAELRPAEPREWNLWKLERRVRERGGVDAARDEEWASLLLYLREFATPEGTLTRDFDPLVRESFGELLEPRRVSPERATP